jgi:hypothetical protein
LSLPVLDEEGMPIGPDRELSELGVQVEARIPGFDWLEEFFEPSVRWVDLEMVALHHLVEPVIVSFLGTR